MCNIAGYVGERRAAPILLEMLRRQQGFDGGACTGITTYYEGRLYTRRIVGDVDKLIEGTDALNLPGTIGIAHTRPGGNSNTYAHTHPFVTSDGRLAGITNGTSRGSNKEVLYALFRELEDNGYTFSSEAFLENKPMPLTKVGGSLNPADVRVNVMHYYHYMKGMPLTAAMAKADSEMYKDGVIELISTDTPDRLYVLRTTRPAVTMTADDGTYIATTRFAFPDDITAEVTQLPLMRPCEIFREGVKVSEDRMTDCEPVSEVTEYTLEEGYKRISALLKGKEDAPLHFDDLEFAVWYDMRDLFEGDHTLIQDARLVYDVLWRLKCEGKLRIKSIKLIDGKKCVETGEYAHDARFIPGQKMRYHMWID